MTTGAVSADAMPAAALAHAIDIERGDWIRNRLGRWSSVAGTVGRDFDAYARVFHPVDAQLLHWEGSRPVTDQALRLRWAEIADRCGTTTHPVMQWSAITAGHSDPGSGQDGWQYGSPDQGRLAQDQLAALTRVLAQHTTTPDAVTAGLWDGFGWIHGGSAIGHFVAVPEGTSRRKRARLLRAAQGVEPAGFPAEVLGGPLLALPGRSYFLFDGDIAVFDDPAWARNSWGEAGAFWGQTPNLLWPRDHAWLMASEIDFDSTLVGGTRAVVDALVSSADLEALEVAPDASLAE